MHFVQHPEHTQWLGAPVGWDHGRIKCDALSVRAVPTPTPHMESAWETERSEALCLALGISHIRLAVYGLQHPPVSMIVHPHLDFPRSQLQARLNDTLKRLEKIAESKGFVLSNTQFVPT